jgi:ATP-dependent Clp protease ATP-binding subunit ClpA
MTSEPDRADVLEEFALEAEQDPQALERYIERYPDLAIDLVDAARELMRAIQTNPKPLSRSEEALIDALWERYSTGVPATAAAPVDAGASPVLRGRPIQDMREIAKKLGLPRQVVTALRQGRVIFATLPDRFLGMLAIAAGATVEAARAELDISRPLASAGSFKADKKISQPQQVSFEQILIDAKVDKATRQRLLGID